MELYIQTVPTKETSGMPGEKINLGRLADLLDSGKSLRAKVLEMIDELEALDRDIEKTKVEMDSGLAESRIEGYIKKIDEVVK
jgi:hypothetical protein